MFCVVCDRVRACRMRCSSFSKNVRWLFVRAFFVLIFWIGIYAEHILIRQTSRQALCMTEIATELDVSSCGKCAHIGFIIVVLVPAVLFYRWARARARFLIVFIPPLEQREYENIDDAKKRNKAKRLHWEIPSNNLQTVSVICTHCLRFISLLHVFDICAVAPSAMSIAFFNGIPSHHCM